MKKKLLKTIGIILLISIIIFIIWKIISYEEKTFNKFDFNPNNHVFNTTEINYLDTIVHAGLQTIKIDSVIIIIKPLEIKNDLLIPDDLELKAHIIGNGIQYIIYIDKMSRKQSINVLSHELIHLKQYYNKELMIIKDSIYWKNELINIFSISYKNRPWEIEAYADQKNIERDMLKILY